MPIGLAPFSIRHHVFDKETGTAAYRKLNELGFDGLENGLSRGAGFTPEEDKAIREELGLQVCDIWGDPNDPDGAIKRAEALGVKLICVGTMPGDMMRSLEGFKAYARWLNEKAKPFMEAGYKLSYHNHAQEFRNFAQIGGKSGYEILIEETCPESIVFCLDTFWASAAGADPAYWLRRIKGRNSTVVHFKEYAIDDRNYDCGIGSIPWRFAEVGQGNINWQAVIEACREIGIEWYCIEQDLHRGCAFDSLKISIDYMRNTLKIV
ncbi:MAG: sugar phosphate isomerase/epimerase [Defluviitaleaceae bacterium]|nr:sugar phosphate isomerase/epimerase [Defluviitaleaceae bacterium]